MDLPLNGFLKLRLEDCIKGRLVHLSGGVQIASRKVATSSRPPQASTRLTVSDGLSVER
jgi:hypothetical protein